MVLPLWEKAWHFFKKLDIEFPCVLAKLLQLYLTLCEPMDHSLPASLSMGFSRQEYWSGLPCTPPGDLPDAGIEPLSPAATALQVGSSLLSHRGSPKGQDTLP